MTTETAKIPIPTGRGAETAEDIIGVLMAISIISKRMASKLAQLEQKNESGEANGKRAKPPD